MTTQALTDATALLMLARHSDLGELERLDLLHRAQSLIEDEIAGAVAVARAENYSWTQIGATLDLSKQGAQQRFSR